MYVVIYVSKLIFIETRKTKMNIVNIGQLYLGKLLLSYSYIYIIFHTVVCKYIYTSGFQFSILPYYNYYILDNFYDFYNIILLLFCM